MLKYSQVKECINDLDRRGLEKLIDNLGEEVVAAGLDCGISASNIEEAYSGQFDSDEDFAQNMAEELGSLDRSLTWPYTCIDWKYAARELMYDYCESNHYYFRNL